MFKFITFPLLCTQSASDILVSPDLGRDVCSAVLASTIAAVWWGTILVCLRQAFSTTKFVTGFYLVAHEEADCCFLISTNIINISHWRPETPRKAFLAKMRSAESHLQIMVNCRRVQSLCLFFLRFAVGWFVFFSPFVWALLETPSLHFEFHYLYSAVFSFLLE